jgi:hypothetical protein
MYRQREGHSEWVEFANVSDADVSIAEWSFADGTALENESSVVTLPNLIIPENGFLILAADSAIFLEFIPDSVTVVVWNSAIPSLNNNGDSLFIFDESDELQDRVDYDPDWGNDEEGISLERISLLSPTNSETNWSFSLDASGSTPGEMNSRALLPPASITTLLTLEPNPFSPDGDGHDDLLAIRYNLEQPDSRLDIKIFDTRGRTVRFLSNNEPAGYFGERLWNGEDDSGRLLPTGLYIVYLEALGAGGTRIQTDKRPVALVRPQ